MFSSTGVYFVVPTPKFHALRANFESCQELAKRAIAAGMTEYDEKEWELFLYEQARKDAMAGAPQRFSFTRVASYRRPILVRCLRMAGRIFDELRLDTPDPHHHPESETANPPAPVADSRQPHELTKEPMRSVLSVQLDRDCYATSQVKMLLEHQLQNHFPAYTCAILEVLNLEDDWYDLRMEHVIPLSAICEKLLLIPWMKRAKFKPVGYFGKKLVGIS